MESGAQSVIMLGAICLPSYVRDTARIKKLILLDFILVVKYNAAFFVS